MILTKYVTSYGDGITLEYCTQKRSVSNIDLIRDPQLITIEDLIPQLRDKEYHFTVVPKDIMYMHNGVRYYYVEIQCDDSNFMINANGSDAERLFKAVNSITE